MSTHYTIDHLYKRITRYEMIFSKTTVIIIFCLGGMLTSLNDVLIPHLKYTLNLDYVSALLIQLTWFLGYFVTSYPASLYVNKTSYKHGFIAGLLCFASGAVLFCIAAILKQYVYFLAALFILSCGVSTFLVTGNSFGSALGSKKTVHKRLMAFHACFAIGTTIAPWFSGPLILSYSHNDATAAARLSHIGTVIPVYGWLAVIMIISALSIYLFPLPNLLAWERDAAKTGKQETVTKAKSSILQYRHTILGALAAFCYVGTETLIGSFMISYIQFLGLNMSPAKMAHFIGYYWGGIMVGRMLGPKIIGEMRPGNLLFFCAALAFILIFIGLFGSGYTALIAITLVGLGNSVMFPLIYSLSIQELSPSIATKASGLVTTAIFGGALIPLFAAWIADNWTFTNIFWVSAACYLYIIFYATKGCHSSSQCVVKINCNIGNWLGKTLSSK